MKPKLLLIETDPLVAMDMREILEICAQGLDIEQALELSTMSQLACVAMIVFRASSDRSKCRQQIEVALSRAPFVIAITDTDICEPADRPNLVIVPAPFTQTNLTAAVISLRAALLHRPAVRSETQPPRR